MESLPEKIAGDRPEKIAYPQHPRLKRMRFLSRLLDNAILLPGGYRIGLDPLLGVVPWAGDFVSGTLSIWLVYDAARLGLPWGVLGRMLWNVLLDTVFGSVPVAGDVFDAVWKSNARNMRLVEEKYHPRMKERHLGRLILALVLVLAFFYLCLGIMLYLAFQLFLSFFPG